VPLRIALIIYVYITAGAGHFDLASDEVHFEILSTRLWLAKCDSIRVCSPRAGRTEMALSTDSAAHYLCKVRDWTLTPLEVQKLLYLAHMVSLGRSNGERPLIRENFQAWDYGPVLPSLYHQLKMFGDSPVRDVFLSNEREDRASAQIIGQVAQRYASKSAGDLVAMTHREGGAWAKNYRPGVKGKIIPDGDILEEYRRRVEGS
jgi:uncharacterized phage-associated protein